MINDLMTLYWPSTNSFQQFILRLEEPRDVDLDLWTRGTLAALDARDPNRHHFPFVQLFEEHVVDEAALLVGDGVTAAHELKSLGAGFRARHLREEVDQREALSTVHCINLAYVLIALSRLRLATRVLESLASRKLEAADEFEAVFATWLVDNRRRGARSGELFGRLRRVIESGRVPQSRQVEVCNQAAVWFVKRGDLNDANLRWYLDRGRAIIKELEGRADPPRAVISSWYRGIAMLPNELLEDQSVIALMDLADESLHAEQALAVPESSDPGREVHRAIIARTLLQSRLKQYCYVTPDPELAATTARRLIDADPSWSINYGDLGEMHLRFADLSEAAVAFDHAVALGPPYVRYHLKSSAAAWANLGDRDQATERYLALGQLGVMPSVLAEQALAVATTKHAVAYFKSLIG